MSKHTEEPWFVFDGLSEEEACKVGGEPPSIVASVQTNTGEWETVDVLDQLEIADLRRAVACVNAMKDIPDPAAFVAVVRELVSSGYHTQTGNDFVDSDTLNRLVAMLKGDANV